MSRHLLACLAISAAVCAQTFPGADECASAGDILVNGINPSPGTSGVTFTNTPGTTSAGTMCGSFNRDVWFLYVAQATGSHTFSTCTPAGFASGTLSDSIMAIYDACGGTQLACNDDFCGLLSQFSVSLNSGSIYYLRVARWGSSTTSGTFYVTVTAPTPPVTNDECGAPTQVFDGANSGLGNTSATNSVDVASCGTFNNDVWFFYLATFTGPAAFTTGCGGAVDTLIAVYDNCGGTELGCNDDTAGCSVGGSTTTVNVVSGAPYFIRVGMKNPVFAGFTLTISALPSNDECASPTFVTLGANGPYSNVGATNSANPAAACGLGGNKNDLWYSFTAFCPGAHSVSTGCGGYDTVVSVYDACGGAELACNDDAAGCGIGGSFVTFSATVGSTYLIRVGSYTQNASGTFTVTISAGAAFSLAFSGPLGPGSVQADIAGGASGGGYVFAVTLTQGSFPNGWLGGLDITIGELIAEINLGFPFVGSLGGCGETTIGPFGGLPTGLSLYATAIGLNAPFGNVTGVAQAQSYVIQ